MLKTYKIRSFKNGENKEGKPFMNYSITVPAKIAEVLPDDVQFTIELTDEGLLFKRAEVQDDSVTVPNWAKSGGNGNGAKKPAAKAKPAAKKAAAKPAAKATKAAGARKRPAAAKPAAKTTAAKPKPGARKRPGAKA